MRRWNVTWYYWWMLFNRSFPWMHGEIIKNKFINFDLHLNWWLRTNKNVSFKWAILTNQSDLIRTLNDPTGYGLILAEFRWMKKEMVSVLTPAIALTLPFYLFICHVNYYKFASVRTFGGLIQIIRVTSKEAKSVLTKGFISVKTGT